MKKQLLIASLLAIAASFSQSALARNLKMELPIGPAINVAAWQAEMGAAVTFEFGQNPNSLALVIAKDVPVSEFARPYFFQNGHRYLRSHAATCNEALRNALSYAAGKAKTKGANHLIVSYSSYFSERPTNASHSFLCNSGVGSSTVDLMVSYAVAQANGTLRVNPAHHAAPAPTMPTAVQVAPLGAIAVTPVPPLALPVAAPAVNQPATTALASGYADVYDIEKIPYIKAPCKKAYAEWLTKPNPKAYVISPAGFCGYSWSNTPSDQTLPSDPTARALLACNARTQGANPCSAYAVDDIVIWRP